MDSHSKIVCLIGGLHIMGFTLFSLDPLVAEITKLSAEGNGEQYVGADPFFHLGKVALFTFLSVLAGLMIRGVVKQSHCLMAPFMIISFVFLATIIILEFSESFFGMRDTVCIIGAEIMILYSICTLFAKLRFRYLKEKSLAG